MTLDNVVVPVTPLLALPPAAVKVFVAIAAYTNTEGVACPSRETLAADTGMSDSTVKRAIGNLVEAGVVTREFRYDGNIQTSSQYRFTAGSPMPSRWVTSDPRSKQLLTTPPSSEGHQRPTAGSPVTDNLSDAPFPKIAEQRLATFDITDFTDWHAAWARINHHNATEPGVPYPPADHLDGYLFDCRVKGFTPSAWRWEGFYRKRRLHESESFAALTRTVQARENWDEFEMRSNRMPARHYGPPQVQR